jgi:aminopeptidase N
MSDATPTTKFSKDYRSPSYFIDSIDLTFDLFEDRTIVESIISCQLNDADYKKGEPLVFVGRELELLSIKINQKQLQEGEYRIDDETLTIPDVPEKFVLEIATKIHPESNTSLEGLYKSGTMFCTQCEAEGFRKISYAPDRPDVMSSYTVKIIADAQKYPILLSNGNPVGNGDLENGRHWIKWEDPHLKPSYLFALVAGDLGHIEDHYTTSSGREVKLQIYTEKENVDKCDYAMQCLKDSMKWDEDVYQREYDLDIFMIVAVHDFNMGAMENKGLNVFNASYVLAKSETAVDVDFQRIQGVIAHEYFHNWTGNRITCRDWFQLSLKEGLTIFRDQQFSADMTSQTVKRIDDVSFLRTVQFAEDAGPMAHPVRPDSYMEINNFYTVTVYHKGAELIRMMYILLGSDAYYKGMALYFERHDGQAVTTEDFVKAMEDANDADLGQFRRWYQQSGTPEISAEANYDETEKSYTLTLSQTCPPTPGQKTKKPFHIPVKMGLLDEQGRAIPLKLDGKPEFDGETNLVLDLKEATQSFRFTEIPNAPTPSIFRGFSAPIKLKDQLQEKDLLFLMSHDRDEFNRWDSGQRLMSRIMTKLMLDFKPETQLNIAVEEEITGLVQSFQTVLNDTSLDGAFLAQLITLPSEAYLAEQMETVAVEAIHHVRESVKEALGKQLKDLLLAVYKNNQTDGQFSTDAKSVGRRSLKNLALTYLMSGQAAEIIQLCLKQYQSADNMTDELSALSCLVNSDCEERIEALQLFYQKWQNDPLVMNLWLSVQAASKFTDLAEIKKLMDHPAFDYNNPNKLRALIATFCSANHINFHVSTGEGYQFLADQVLTLNHTNPQIAARILTPFTKWRRYDSRRQDQLKSQIERILDSKDLSRNVFEIVSKTLA